MTVLKFKRPSADKKESSSKAVKSQSIEEQINNPPEGFDIDFDCIYHLVTERSAANGDNNDPIVSTGSAEMALRKLIAKYGFDRMPLTLGELNALLEYCSILEATAFKSLAGAPQFISWKKALKSTYAESEPALYDAMCLYMADNLQGLKEFHRQNDTLTCIGKAYKDFD